MGCDWWLPKAVLPKLSSHTPVTGIMPMPGTPHFIYNVYACFLSYGIHVYALMVVVVSLALPLRLCVLYLYIICLHVYVFVCVCARVSVIVSV